MVAVVVGRMPHHRRMQAVAAAVSVLPWVVVVAQRESHAHAQATTHDDRVEARVSTHPAAQTQHVWPRLPRVLPLLPQTEPGSPPPSPSPHVPPPLHPPVPAPTHQPSPSSPPMVPTPPHAPASPTTDEAPRQIASRRRHHWNPHHDYCQPCCHHRHWMSPQHQLLMPWGPLPAVSIPVSTPQMPPRHASPPAPEPMLATHLPASMHDGLDGVASSVLTMTTLN